MAGINKAILIGNLGKDPEVRHLENGRAVANFSLATSETYRNKQGEKVTTTEWHNVVLWSPLAELAEKYLKKGRQIYLEGKITNRSYEDKTGVTKYITEIVGRDMTFLDSPSREGQSNNQSSHSEPTKVETATVVGKEEIDDLPF